MTSPDALLGRILDDKYRLDDVLGAGGMGVVFRASDLGLNRGVAVKIVRGDVAGRGVGERFRREAQAVARLRHPHIVTIHDFGISDVAGAYLVMELLDGRSLREELDARGRIPVNEAVEIGRQVCRALDAAHGAGVVHRDVKPENIFLEGTGGDLTVKVVDFGIARLESAADATGTSTSRTSVLGTPRYMSPEQFDAGRGEDRRSDVYSLGCVLYEALAGRPPFTADSVAALLLAHVHETPAPPSRHAPDVPPAIEAAILRAMAKRPEDRFQTAGELGRALGPGVATLVVEEPAPRAFAFGPFRVPHDVDLLYRDGEPVALERQAVRMLRYLAINRERVVTKQELLDELWPDTFTTDSVLKRLVSLARAALGDDAKAPGFIRTYHGQGYQFVAPISTGAPVVAGTEVMAISRADTDPGTRASTPAGGPHETQTGRLTNLPYPVTSFVGRASALEGVRDALGRSRLVTLVGPGGIGKTRLAIEVARGALAEYADGVWLVELASLADPDLVPRAVAAVLDVRERPDRSPTDALVEWAAQKRLLLVLDNCEHVIDACATLVERLLPASDGLRVLATSREVFDVDGEAVWPVPALGAAAPGAAAPGAAAPGDEAVRLFVERARAVRPDFALSREEEPAVARLCGDLEGIPLSIELAAARVRTFTVDELLAKMGDRFSLLARSRDRGGRHKTLRATIDWSYDHLEPAERALLARLSVFAGGWTRESADAVVDSDTRHPLDRLVDKSLVLWDGARYGMLETIRRYAAEKLAESGDEAAVRRAHLDWFLRLAERARAAGRGPALTAAFASLEAEHDNLRAALGWSREAGALEPYARLCVALRLFWDARGYWSESARRLGHALETRAELPAPLRADLAHMAGASAERLGDFAGAARLFEEAIDLRRGSDDRAALADSLRAMGMVTTAMGEYDRAEGHLRETLAIVLDLADDRRVALALAGLGYLSIERGAYGEAERTYEESAAIYERLGHRLDVSHVLHNLGELAMRRGDLERAERLLEECLATGREFDIPIHVSRTLQVLASIAVRRGDGGRARTSLRESAGVAREIGDRPGIALVVETYASLAAAEGDAPRALRLAGVAASLRASIRAPLSPFEQESLDRSLEPARRALGHERARRETDVGSRMSLDEAVAYALET